MASSSKYMDIVAWTMNQIAAGAFLPGDKFLSENALGERFGYSRQTVRRALEVLEQGSHIVRIQGSGTYIAAAPAAGRQVGAEGAPSMTIGVISLNLDDYIFPGIIRGIESVCTPSGYALQLASTQDEVAGETRALQLMLEGRLAGLIVEPTKSGLPCVNLDLYRVIAQRGIPLVFTDSRYTEVEAPYVAPDDAAVGYIATRHLLDMGHRRIAGLFTHCNRAGLQRYQGYARALAEHGLPVREEHVHWYCNRDQMIEMLEGKLLRDSLSACTAVFCYNDQLALRLMELLGVRGRRVPDDLSVVGVDNTRLAEMCGLSSVIHPGERLGVAAAKLLLSMIGGGEGRTILFPPELMMRGSVRRWEE